MANENMGRIEQALLEIDLALHFLQPSGLAYELALDLKLRTLKNQIEAQKADMQVTLRLTITECMGYPSQHQSLVIFFKNTFKYDDQ